MSDASGLQPTGDAISPFYPSPFRSLVHSHPLHIKLQ